MAHGLSIHQSNQVTADVGATSTTLLGYLKSGDHFPRKSEILSSKVLGAFFSTVPLGAARVRASIGHKVSTIEDLTFNALVDVDNGGVVNQSVFDTVFGVQVSCADFFSLSGWALAFTPFGTVPALGKPSGQTVVTALDAPFELTYYYDSALGAWFITFPKVEYATMYRLIIYEGICLSGIIAQDLFYQQPEDGSSPMIRVDFNPGLFSYMIIPYINDINYVTLTQSASTCCPLITITEGHTWS